MEQPKEYYAFISYKREDEKWAKWLQDKLEHYHLPTTLNGKDLPKNLCPVFRDVDELSAGNLPEQIFHALSNSKNLIVVCSPRAAKSEWVNKEIEDFIKIKNGNTNNIFPFIIEGEPYSKDANTECYPYALINLPQSEERYGGNINETGGSNVAVVKTIAGMLGVSHDSLWRRYEKEQIKKRNYAIALFLAIGLLAMGIIGWMIQSDWNMMKNQARAVASKANELIDKGDNYTAKRILLEVVPKSWMWHYWPNHPYVPEVEAAFRRSFKSDGTCLYADVFCSEGKGLFFSSDGMKLCAVLKSDRVIVWNVEDGNVEYEKFVPGIISAFFNNEGRILICMTLSRIIIWDYNLKKEDSIRTGLITVGTTNKKGTNLVTLQKCNKKTGKSSNNYIIKIWNIYNLNLIDSINVKFSSDRISEEMTFSADNSKLFIKELWGEKYWILDLHTRKVTENRVLNNKISLCPNSDYAFIARRDSTLVIRNMLSGEENSTKCKDFICNVKRTNTDKFVVGCSKRSVYLWELNSSNQLIGRGKKIYSFDADIEDVASCPTKNLFAVTCDNGAIHVFKNQDKINFTRVSDNYGSVVGISNNIKFVGLEGRESYSILDLEKNEEHKLAFPPNNNTINNIIFHPDNEHFILYTNESIGYYNLKGVRLCDLPSKIIKSIGRAQIKIDNSGRVVTIYKDSLLEQFRIPSGEKITSTKWPILSHIKGVSNDAHTAVIEGLVGMNSAVYLSKIDNSQQKSGLILKGMSKMVGAAFSEDDMSIAIYDSYNIRNYKVNKPDIVWEKNGINVTIRNISFRPTNSEILVLTDSSLIIMDSKSGSILDTYHVDKIDNAFFSSNGKNIITSAFEEVSKLEYPSFKELVEKTRDRFKKRMLTPEERRNYFLE